MSEKSISKPKSVRQSIVVMTGVALTALFFPPFLRASHADTADLPPAHPVSALSGFQGVPWGASRAKTIAILSKSFTLKYAGNNTKPMELTGGEMDGAKVDNVFVTVGNLGFVKATVYFEKADASQLFSDYDKFKALYVKKLGKPVDHFEFLQDPYTLGDGHEAEAIRASKSDFATFWEFPGTAGQSRVGKPKDGKPVDSVIVEISEFMEIDVAYENGPLMEAYLAKSKAAPAKHPNHHHKY